MFIFLVTEDIYHAHGDIKRQTDCRTHDCHFTCLRFSVLFHRTSSVFLSFFCPSAVTIIHLPQYIYWDREAKKDAVLKRYVIWKLDITYYDENYVGHKETIYEQFAPLQESVPQGNIYITYDPERPDYKFIIPNMLVGAFDTNKDLILGYEKNFKNMKYLNVYYNHGLIVETFAESLNTKKPKKA